MKMATELVIMNSELKAPVKCKINLLNNCQKHKWISFLTIVNLKVSLCIQVYFIDNMTQWKCHVEF